MAYLNEDGLARYDGLIKQWVTLKSGTVDGVDALLNWQKTSTAGAVTCYPLPAAPIDPVVNFLFTETGPASGTKGLDNPSTIAGVSSVKVTRTGKNLLTKIPMASTMPQRGITVTYNADGSIHLSGTASSSSLPYLRFFTVEPGIVPSILTAGTTLTVSLICSDSGVYCALYDSDSPTLWGDATIIYPGTPVTHTMSANVKTANLSMVVTRGAVIDCDVYCQIEFGQSATAWEAPADEDYTVNLGGTYYGGSVDLSAGTMTVTFSGIVLDGSENWSLVGSGTFYRYKMVMSSPAPSGEALAPVYNTEKCTHFDIQNSVSYDTQHAIVSGDGITIFTTQTSVESFKAWLAAQATTGTSVCLAWPLATPFNVPLAPTQIYSLSQINPYNPRINTVYSDQVSVQVGYPKSPIATASELTNAIVSLGSNL